MLVKPRNLAHSLSWRGFAWSVALPGLWILLYYTFIAHVWFSLGRWPRFGENLNGSLINWHYNATTYLFIGLAYSLSLAAVVMVLCLLVRSWRHLSLYALCYGAAVGVAFLALFFLAPHAFRNWLFD